MTKNLKLLGRSFSHKSFAPKASDKVRTTIKYFYWELSRKGIDAISVCERCKHLGIPLEDSVKRPSKYLEVKSAIINVIALLPRG